MITLLDLTIRSSTLLLIGLCVHAAMHRRSAAWRHGILAAAIAGAAAMPPLGWAVPAWEVGSLSARVAAPATVVQPAGADASKLPGSTVAVDRARSASAGLPLPAVVWLWLAGVIASAAGLVIRVLRLRGISRRATPVTSSRWTGAVEELSESCGIRSPVAVLETDVPGLIATWGLFRHRILVPVQAREWSDDRVCAVLRHELAHVRRHDWLVQVSAEAVRTLYWFNPLMTIACRSLRRQSEHACDDEVLGAGMPAFEYASHLLEVARSCRPGRPWRLVMPMARQSTLERRIGAMLIAGLDRRPLSRRAVVLMIVLTVCAALPIAAARAAQDSPLPLTGSIYDASGGVLPGVTVSLQDTQEFTWTATTDSAGQFEFPPVQPGRYVLEARLPGFRTLRDEFDLKTARDWNRAITMPVGELQETIHVRASRTSPSPPQRPRPIRVGGNIKAPLKIVNVNPVYPNSMREAGLSGVVPIEAIIATDGSVLSARVRGAHVHPDFAAAALEAVRQWQFTPTLLNGAPVEVVMNVTVTFTLSD